jgi:hypothetical protein
LVATVCHRWRSLIVVASASLVNADVPHKGSKPFLDHSKKLLKMMNNLLINYSSKITMTPA